MTPAYRAYRVRIVAAQKEAHPHGGGRPHGKVRLGDRDGCNVDTGSHMLDKHSTDSPAANTRRWSPPSVITLSASVGQQATLSVGTYRMVRVGETRPSAGMYRDSRKSTFSPRSPHVDAWSVRDASRVWLMTGSPEPILSTVYSRVVTPDPWRHVTFVNYQNGCGRAED